MVLMTWREADMALLSYWRRVWLNKGKPSTGDDIPHPYKSVGFPERPGKLEPPPMPRASKDLRIKEATPEALARAVMRGGANRPKRADQDSQEGELPTSGTA